MLNGYGSTRNNNCNLNNYTMTKKQKTIILILRLALGFLFLYAGLTKMTEGFSAAGYLNNATNGPLADLFTNLAGNKIVDLLVIWGETLIGAALLMGIFLRFACAMGILQMTLFYLSSMPPEHGPINDQFIYALVFLTLAVFTAGRYYGLDAYLEKSKFFKHKVFKYLLG